MFLTVIFCLPLSLTPLLWGTHKQRACSLYKLSFHTKIRQHVIFGVFSVQDNIFPIFFLCPWGSRKCSLYSASDSSIWCNLILFHHSAVPKVIGNKLYCKIQMCPITSTFFCFIITFCLCRDVFYLMDKSQWWTEKYSKVDRLGANSGFTNYLLFLLPVTTNKWIAGYLSSRIFICKYRITIVPTC